MTYSVHFKNIGRHATSWQTSTDDLSPAWFLYQLLLKDTILSETFTLSFNLPGSHGHISLDQTPIGSFTIHPPITEPKGYPS